MSTTFRLLLATIVLLAQTSLGRLVCACLPDPAPAPKPSAVCAMSNRVGCTCCKSEKTGDKAFTKAGQACLLTVSSTSQPTKLALDVPLLEVPAILPQALPLRLLVSDSEAPLKPAPLLARSRAPDQGLHGLRAPPAC